jgi:hypothetical protein
VNTLNPTVQSFEFEVTHRIKYEEYVNNISLSAIPLARSLGQVNTNTAEPPPIESRADIILDNLMKDGLDFMVFNATFNNISVLSWRSVLLVEETRVQH